MLGASNYTYAEAPWTLGLEDWIGSHVSAMACFGAVPEIVVPGDPKSGVTKAHRYEPKLNRTYREGSKHYGVGILPARPIKLRDKAKAETGVAVVARWILARLRNRRVFSLGELNEEGRRPIANTAEAVFARIGQAIGLREVRPDGKRGHGPRIHDLRHTMAVRTIIGWYRRGCDPNREMIKLSTYLGHRLPSSAYWCIEAVPELIHLACERAEQAR